MSHGSFRTPQEAKPARATPSAADAELADLIRATERKRLRVLVEADMAVAEQLHTDDFQLINPGRGALTKEEYLGGVASGEINYLVWEPDSEIAVRLYDGAAAIRYRSNTEIVVGGESTSSETGTPMFMNSMRVCGKSSGLKPLKSSNGHAEGSGAGQAENPSSIAAEVAPHTLRGFDNAEGVERRFGMGTGSIDCCVLAAMIAGNHS